MVGRASISGLITAFTIAAAVRAAVAVVFAGAPGQGETMTNSAFAVARAALMVCLAGLVIRGACRQHCTRATETERAPQGTCDEHPDSLTTRRTAG